MKNVAKLLAVILTVVLCMALFVPCKRKTENHCGKGTAVHIADDGGRNYRIPLLVDAFYHFQATVGSHDAQPETIS